MIFRGAQRRFPPCFLLNQVEAYEKGADAVAILASYKNFKDVVKSKGQERQIDRDFEAVSGYSTYRVVKVARDRGKELFVLETKYHFAQTIVLEAGNFLRQHLHDDLQIEEKGDFTDLVTHLDKQVQEMLTQQIQSRYQGDGILGEEGGDVSSIHEGNVWVIDPIDGTTNFIAQKTDFAIMIAYFENGVGKFGIIYDVMRDKLFHGGDSFPVYCNQERLKKPEAPSSPEFDRNQCTVVCDQCTWSGRISKSKFRYKICRKCWNWFRPRSGRKIICLCFLSVSMGLRDQYYWFFFRFSHVKF